MSVVPEDGLLLATANQLRERFFSLLGVKKAISGEQG